MLADELLRWNMCNEMLWSLEREREIEVVRKKLSRLRTGLSPDLAQQGEGEVSLLSKKG
jgi:hypothetical protein